MSPGTRTLFARGFRLTCSLTLPQMSTFFDEIKLYSTVPVVDEQILTAEFLEASRGLVKLFDLLGSTAFSPVTSDMNGNIEKVSKKMLADPKANTLQGLILSEVTDKKKTATQGLLWLCRGLQFTAQAMREAVDNPSIELTKAFTDAYLKTLSKYHGMLVKPIFKLAMNACPYRKDFFEKLGADQAKVNAQLLEWLEALEKIIAIIFAFFELGNYGKGL